MALVKPDTKKTVKLNLEEADAKNLDGYAKFARASRASVAEVALTRLFAADPDWQAHKATLQS